MIDLRTVLSIAHAALPVVAPLALLIWLVRELRIQRAKYRAMQEASDE